MKINKIFYKVKTAPEKEIFAFLSECSGTYIPPLDQRVNVREYTKKIFEKSVTFEAWGDGSLLGFVAGYFNDTAGGSAFITNVSVVRTYRGLGIASKLLDMCIEYAGKHNFREVTLEAHAGDTSAMNLYHKFNFKNYKRTKDILMMKREIV